MRQWLLAQEEEQDSSLTCLKQVENWTKTQRSMGGGKEQPGPRLSREAPTDGRWGGQGGRNLRGCGAAHTQR